MAEPTARHYWLRRIGDLILALMLLAFALWLIMAGHFMATCPAMSDWFSWSVLALFSLPILNHWVVAAWLALALGLASLRPLSASRRFWMMVSGVTIAGLVLAVALGVTEHLLGLRTRCSLGGW